MSDIEISASEHIRIFIRNPDGTLQDHPVIEVQPGGLEGGARVILGSGTDIENVRNIQMGFGDSPNGDISAGGDGTAKGGARGALVFNRDNGYGTFIGRGRATRSWAMEVRTYDDRLKDYVGFLNTPVRVRHLLVPDGKGGWRKAAV